jgi:hypothetical protein
VSLSSTYWMAQRPSIDPTANPLASAKQLTTLVCHFSGLVIVFAIVVGLAKLTIWMCRSAVPITNNWFLTSMVYTRSPQSTVPTGWSEVRSQYLTVLSQEPVARKSFPLVWNQRTHLTAA